MPLGNRVTVKNVKECLKASGNLKSKLKSVLLPQLNAHLILTEIFLEKDYTRESLPLCFFV